jgi:hypothetical protein
VDEVATVITMDAAVFNLTSNVTKAACQALCVASSDCQYFAWYDLGDDATSCYLRGGGVAAVDVTDNSGAYIAFPARSQGGSTSYVAYNAHATDWDSTGVQIGGDYASFDVARDACRVEPDCAGLKSNAGTWRIFSASSASFATSKSKVAGAAITV